MHEHDVSDLVRRLFSAFLSHDREATDDLSRDDFTFHSPRDKIKEVDVSFGADLAEE